MSVSVLAAEACIRCKKGETEPLNYTDALALLAEVPGWEIEADGRSIKRQLKFKNFRESLAFVNQLGEVAEAAKHHPDITFGWGYAEVVYTTHDVGGLHRNDFVMAAKTNEMIGEAA